MEPALVDYELATGYYMEEFGTNGMENGPKPRVKA